MLRFGIFVALFVVVWGQTTQVNQCTFSSGALPINAHIAGCTTPPCSLQQLEYAVINIVFIAPRAMTTMTTLANAFLFGPFPIPYGLGENAYTCNFLDNSYCPVLEGEILQYTLYMYIENFFPVGISPTVEFRIEDDNRSTIMCIRVPITITPPAEGRVRNATAPIHRSYGLIKKITQEGVTLQ